MKIQILIYMLNQTADQNEWLILYLFTELFIQPSEAWYPKLTVPL